VLYKTSNDLSKMQSISQQSDTEYEIYQFDIDLQRLKVIDITVID
jgi:hypothetical protein